MDQLHRASFKFFTSDQGPSAVDLPAFVPIFHRWIQNKAVDALLIDVHDYKHVPNGPGILLVGHECDYAMDMTSGEPGLLYRQKRGRFGPLPQRVRDGLRGALTGCRLLEQDEELQGKVAFDYGRLLITLDDRLRAPNTAEGFQAVKGPIEQALSDLLPGASLSLSHDSADDPRRMLSLAVSLSPAIDPGQVLERLSGSAVGQG